MRNIIIFAMLMVHVVYAQDAVQSEIKFSNESEFAMLQTTGNSEVETYNLKTLSKWEGPKRIIALSGHYTLGFAEETDDTTGESDKVETARNWDLQLKYERKLSEHFSYYAAVQREGDDFSGIDYRDNYDLGLKYYFIKSDKIVTFSELGYRYTNETRIEEDDNGETKFHFNKGRVYYEIVYKKSEDMSTKFWIEYLPNFTESEDYIISYEPSIAYVLNSTFSLKTAYKVVYDNLPNVEGNKRTDTQMTTSIIAKF